MVIKFCGYDTDQMVTNGRLIMEAQVQTKDKLHRISG
jgi:hypothetical protein